MCDKDFTTVLKFYQYGYDLSVIAEDFNSTEEEVKHILKTELKKIPFKLRKELIKELALKRTSFGFTQKSISQETGSSVQMIRGFACPKDNKLENQCSVEIQWDSYEKCPCCKGTNVQDVTLQQGDNKTAYCNDCYTEWYEECGKMYKVLWEYLN